ncbi:CD3073 family putative ECF transporter S component [Clostridium sp. Cult1]|jgi:energy-coupling factor transport system substrate-specific component|uniref:CD3073 family putative ECF transporter S component n=1 Tax=Clostridium sp. Cult1 TaxID=2079002 RepID=UPI001F474F41|nr:CD3073 family putative ECF transporter S component [Clostridium sp. Cult1]MCF6462910.1 ECF transporter S component [Clostridium sp. Cult1]
MNNRNNTYALIFSALGIAVNIVLGTVSSILNIPLLFLDTIGTIFTAATFGPFYGALTGGLTNVIQGIITNPKSIPFALVNIVVGIIVGLIARKKKFTYLTAIITGLILAVIAPLVGTPIAVYVYGGITGDFNDVFFTWLVQTGQTVFTAAFIPRITSNIVDKVASCMIVAFLMQRLPNKFIQGAK